MKRSQPLKRTPMKRGQPLKSSSPDRATVKTRKCKVCRAPFVPRSMTHKACGPECAEVIAQTDAGKRAKKAAQEDKRNTRAQLEAMKTVPILKKEAQHEFNRYVRLRDAGKNCFVCGIVLAIGGTGGGFDAGHIRSRSNADNLRFDERNVHGQCKPCNAVGATKDHEMRAAADRLLGAATAEALYADNTPIKWTRDALRVIRETYRARANALAKAA